MEDPTYSFTGVNKWNQVNMQINNLTKRVAKSVCLERPIMQKSRMPHVLMAVNVTFNTTQTSVTTVQHKPKSTWIVSINTDGLHVVCFLLPPSHKDDEGSGESLLPGETKGAGQVWSRAA